VNRKVPGEFEKNFSVGGYNVQPMIFNTNLGHIKFNVWDTDQTKEITDEF